MLIPLFIIFVFMLLVPAFRNATARAKLVKEASKARRDAVALKTVPNTHDGSNLEEASSQSSQKPFTFPSRACRGEELQREGQRGTWVNTARFQRMRYD